MFELRDGDNGHYSMKLGYVVPRVTSIVGMVKHENLILWKIKKGIDRALFWRKRVPNNVEAKAHALKDLELKPEAERGTLLHSIMEQEILRMRAQ